MAEDWPFLHLNLLSPNVTSRELSLTSTLDQDPSHHSLELARQLEAWTNIDFNFDVDPAADPNPPYPPRESFDLGHSNPSFDQLFGFSSSKVYPQPSATPSYVVPVNPTLQTVLSSDRANGHTQQNLFSVPPVSMSSSTHPAEPFMLEPVPRLNVRPVAVQANPPAPSTVSQSSPSPPKMDSSVTAEQQPTLDDEEANKIAVEDDKRRRNTLASARFRIKKKMKEQEIERTAKEMKDRVAELEKQVESLKQENKWLRGLIVEQAAIKVSGEIEVPEPSVGSKRAQVDDLSETPSSAFTHLTKATKRSQPTSSVPDTKKSKLEKK